jgi:hypothetical protein
MFLLLTASSSLAASAGTPAYEGYDQFAQFPKPLSLYQHSEDAGAWAMIKERAAEEPFNVVATVIFVLAVLHTFVAGMFREWSHKLEKAHLHQHGPDTEKVSFWAVVLHFFGEVEAVFGLWVMVLAGAALWFHGWTM